MMVDGRAIATGVLARAKARAEKLPRVLQVVALVGEETPATKSYLKIKERAAGLAGCAFQTRALGADVSDADAVIVQLPVPAGMNRDAILNAIPPEKDADVLSRAAREKFERGDADALLPPVVGAVAEIFKMHGVRPEGKRAAVLGRGFLVGEPAAAWLAQQGAQVTVLDIDTPRTKFSVALRAADIIISGIGSPHFIKPELVAEGVVLVDAGTSELGGKLAGDADPACTHVSSLFTPVPGGVGPIAVAKLFENAVLLAERKMAR